MANMKEKEDLGLKWVSAKKMEGTSERPRLSVFRSNKVIYAQIIDDSKGHNLALLLHR